MSCTSHIVGISCIGLLSATQTQPILIVADLDSSRFLLCFRTRSPPPTSLWSNLLSWHKCYQIWSLTHAPKSGIFDNVLDLPCIDSEQVSHSAAFDCYSSTLNTNRYPREISRRDFRFHRSSETSSLSSPVIPPVQRRFLGDFLLNEISARTNVVFCQPIWCAISRIHWGKFSSVKSPSLAVDQFSPTSYCFPSLGCLGFVAYFPPSRNSQSDAWKPLLSRPNRQSWPHRVHYWWN